MSTVFRGFIGHVLNGQGTGYEHIFSWCEHSISIKLKMGHVISKSIQKLVKFTKFDGYWFKRKGMVHF